MLAAAHDVQLALPDADLRPRRPTRSPTSAHQLDRLLPKGFVTATGAARLADLTRYLTAIGRRLDRLPHSVGADRERMQRVHAVQDALDDLVGALSPARAAADDIRDIARQIEELRVSLWAQQLGTPRRSASNASTARSTPSTRDGARSGIDRSYAQSRPGPVAGRLGRRGVALLAGCGGGQPSADHRDGHSTGPIPVVTPVVLAEMPHDTSAWIEGLEFDGPTLYEGTGLAGQSQLRELDPATGAVRRAAPVPNNYYGEGITVVGDRIWELTWQNGVAVEWDKTTLTPIREVPVDGEGWGLCNDGDRLIRSDGTDRLRFHDPTTFAETGSIGVTRDGQPVTNINELDCVDGQVWANVWMSDTIVRIDPATGEVNAVVDASELAGKAGPRSTESAERHRAHRGRRVPDHRQVLAEDVPGAHRRSVELTRNSLRVVQGCPTHDL